MIIICLFSPTLALALQIHGKLTAVIQNEKREALENVTVSLLKTSDSSLVKTGLTDKEGIISFEDLVPGTYTLLLTASGYDLKYSDLIIITESRPEITLGSITLVNKAAQLKEVTVSARKPFIQRLHDRIVVNVDNSIISAGSSAFEVLERSPGITIDPNDIIALKGKQGVIIMIDGKPTAMAGPDLINYLKGLPSNSIDRIEIITNPSSKYDAAGNSGIIDIKMKKDQRMGTNGTFTADYGQGIYTKANAGSSVNYRNKKVNLFANYNYSYRKGLNHLFLDRNFYNNGIYSGGDLKDNHSTSPFYNNTMRTGADFFPSKKTIIGFVVNANFNRFTRNNNNNSVKLDNLHLPVYTFQTNAKNDDHANNVVANINYKHTFDSTGRELTADADYGAYDSRSLSTTATRYYKISGSALQPDYILNGNQRGKLTLKTAKADYVNPLKKGTAIEAGFKTSFVSSDNDAKFYDASSGVLKNDTAKTNHFLYDENNNAAYINFKKTFKKFDIQFGMRAEQTNVKTYQAIGNIGWDSSYIQFFPTAFLNYKIREDQTIGASVSRRIDRPGYAELNPFLFLIDVTTYATGNPGLLPQFTWSYELNYTVKNLNFGLSYSHTQKSENVVIARFNEVFPATPKDSNVTVQIPVNLSSNDYVGLSVSTPVKFTKWWNMIGNADIYYNHYNGKLGITTLNNGKPAADIRVNNTFTFNKEWTTELNGTYNSGGQYGFMVMDPQWGISAGIQKSILEKKGTIKFNINDIFWTNLPKAVITYDNYIEKWHAQRESRVANLSFTYRFGKKTVQAARRRTTGSEEERQRAGN